MGIIGRILGYNIWKSPATYTFVFLSRCSSKYSHTCSYNALLQYTSFDLSTRKNMYLMQVWDITYPVCIANL